MSLGLEGKAAFDAYEEASVWNETGFGSTTLPSWVSDMSDTGGSVTADQTNGQAVIESTTGGDAAELRSDSFRVDNYDGVYFGAVFAHANDSTENGTAQTNAGIVDSDVSDGIYHQLNDTDSTAIGTLRVRNGGADQQVFDTRSWISASPLVTEFIWDLPNYEIIHRYQDVFGARTSSGGFPTQSEEYQVRVRCRPSGEQTGTHTLNLHALKIAFVNKL